MSLNKFFLSPEEALIVAVDFQEKLANAMKDEVVDKILSNATKIFNLTKVFNIPVIFTEQYPKGLGQTLQNIKIFMEEEPIEKLHFSCLKEEKFIQKFLEKERKKIILIGMETHVCILQTALDFLARDYVIFVPKDAVCSRRKEDWKTGLELIGQAGGVVTCTETLIFQILRKAGTAEFKKMLEFVK